ncbi:hypothetical protein NKR19_g2084 [Coniochaeta hoffmannii]|uniref:Uncharacterized protein n=1 Tax=Coniochaeta hoffmannii TaxID=91930 RepID=A0AA38VZG5_9PEZI|nr:hypothetical protein NKR19_g2084 [Coniochaeta hoffmannii]
MERLAETTQLAQVVEQQRNSLAEAAPAPLQRASKSDFEDYEDNSAKPAPLTVRRATSKESLTIGDGHANSHRDGNKSSPPVTLTPWNDTLGAGDMHGVASAERSNAFFGSPEAHLFRTISPYRRALRKSMDEAENDMHGRNSGDRIVSNCGTEIRRPDEACYDDAYSESVYSSDEPPAGPVTKTIQSLTGMVQAPPSSAGNMSMSADPPVTYRPTGHRVVSSELAPLPQTGEESRSPAHRPCINRLSELNNMVDTGRTPTPRPPRLQKKRSGFLYTPSIAKSDATSPGLTAAVEKQFGPASKTPVSNDENKENEVSGGSNGTRKSGPLGSAFDEGSAKGRKMVDVFLSRRRKRMASSSDDSPAFL